MTFKIRMKVKFLERNDVKIFWLRSGTKVIKNLDYSFMGL